jgi:selenocysteine lyase/cysteine desulfurase
LPGARRFDSGEKCTPTILPGAIAALEQIKKWGVSAIVNSLSAINMRIAVSLEELGFQLPDSSLRCPHILGAELPGHYKGNLVGELKSKNIYISQRGNSLRFAPHLYVSEIDVGRLLNILDDIIKK